MRCWYADVVANGKEEGTVDSFRREPHNEFCTVVGECMVQMLQEASVAVTKFSSGTQRLMQKMLAQARCL